MKITGVALIVIFSFGLVGCNLNRASQAPLYLKPKDPLPAEALSELSYIGITQKIFVPKCISCHGDSGGVNLESYSEVVKNLWLIKKAVLIEKTMPKNDSLTTEELSYLSNWIEIGAPEQPANGEPPPVVEPPPMIEPLVATYESIDKHIFQKSCKDCHNPLGSGKRVSLEKEALLNSPLELIIPQNPDESGLVIAIERNDNKRMPPEKDGYSALTDETKIIIRQWIENGAKD